MGTRARRPTGRETTGDPGSESAVRGTASWLSELAGPGPSKGRLKGPAARMLLWLGLIALAGMGVMGLGDLLAPAGRDGGQDSSSSDGGSLPAAVSDPGGSGATSDVGSPSTSDGMGLQGGPAGVADLEAAIERHLERILSQIQGAGRVTVAVCLETGATYVYGYDESQTSQTTQERDSTGGTRTVTQTDSSRETVVVTQGSSSEPVVVRVTLPSLAGVVVVASGASDSRVKALLSQAVQILYGVPAHRVIVLAGG